MPLSLTFNPPLSLESMEVALSTLLILVGCIESILMLEGEMPLILIAGDPLLNCICPFVLGDESEAAGVAELPPEVRAANFRFLFSSLRFCLASNAARASASPPPADVFPPSCGCF